MPTPQPLDLSLYVTAPRLSAPAAVALGREQADPNLSVYQTNLERVTGLLSKGGAGTKD